LITAPGQLSLAAADRISASNRGEISGGNPLVSILKPSKAVTSGFQAGDSPFPGVSKPISFEVASPRGEPLRVAVSGVPSGTGDAPAQPIPDLPSGGSSLTHVSGMGGGELLFTPLAPERQGEGHQRAAFPTLPSSGPGAWLQSGKRFTSALPQVEGYRSDYYRLTAQGADAGEALFLSLQCSLAHSVALPAKSAGNAVLRRRDLRIEQMKRLSSSHLKGSLRTASLSGTYLFHDSLPDMVEAQQKSDALYRPPAPAKSGTRPVASQRGGPDRALSDAPVTGGLPS
jgi:hypothetical protein